MSGAKIKCPHCGYHTTSIVNCDYGFGHGTEFECGSNSCGRRFVNMSDPRTPAEALRRAAWKVFGAAAFSLRCHDSAYAEDRVSDEEKYAAECVAEQRIGYTLLVEADRLAALPVQELSDALPVAELSAEAKERARQALNASLYYVCMAVEIDSRTFVANLRAAGFAIVEMPPLTGVRISRLWTDGDQMFQRLYYGQAKEEK